MSEREYQVVAFGVDYGCDECGKGDMIATTSTDSLVPTFKFEPSTTILHRCTHCGVLDYLTEKYPTVRFRRIPDGPITEGY